MNPQPRHDETTMRIEIQLKASKAPGSKLILLGGGTVKLNPSSLLGIESEMTSDLESLGDLPIVLKNMLKTAGFELEEA